jgi:four helix bundle protein
MNENKKQYDLEERTLKFSEDIIIFVSRIKRDTITSPLISQLVRSATSIGANYCEANGASSKKDFKNKIYICKKEAKETKYWLQLILKALPDSSEKCKVYLKEAQELTLIFSKIAQTIENQEN